MKVEENDPDDVRARRAEARFARLRDSGIIGIIVATMESRVVEINDALLGLLGLEREEILSGKIRWRSLTPPEWSAVDERAIEQLRTTGVCELREKEFFRKDGTRAPVLIRTAMLDEHETISFVLDISERKKANAALEQARIAQRIAAIVEASDDAIVGKALDGTITSWNPGATRIFGYSADEAIGRSIMMIIPPGEERVEMEVLRASSNGETRHFEATRRRKDGREVVVSVTTSPIRDASGAVIGVSKVARDVTEAKRAAEALARAKDEADSANRELEAFSYSVAHDLRAPLRGMNGFAQLLLDTYGEHFDEEGHDWLCEILNNAKKMSLLIDALLSLSRVTRTELRRDDVDLSALVRAAGQKLAHDEPWRTVEIVVEPDLHIDADPNLARALVENLVGNAWKFTSKTRAARIELGSVSKGDEKIFFIRDNGAGFDPRFANKLFSPFQRLHSNEEFSGTGIGLATVHRIVRRHGGRVWAEGTVGAGATIYFSIPPRPAHSPSAAS